MAEISLLYFAWLRERIGQGTEQLDLPDGIDRVDRLIEHLSARGAGYRAAFIRPRALRCAVNQVMATPRTPISPGDEVAFFPPVTGG